MYLIISFRVPPVLYLASEISLGWTEAQEFSYQCVVHHKLGVFPHTSRFDMVEWWFFHLWNTLTWQPVFGSLRMGCVGLEFHFFAETLFLGKKLLPQMHWWIKGGPLSMGTRSVVGGYVIVRGGFPPLSRAHCEWSRNLERVRTAELQCG